MTPTNELRFVKRMIVGEEVSPNTYSMKEVRVLQQKWEDLGRMNMYWKDEYITEWRDVPLVEEDE